MKLIILETSDVHGSIYPINYADNRPRDVGMGKIASLIHKERAEAPCTLLIDNGDMIQGTPLLYYYARFDHKRPNPMAVVANHLNYDCAVFGNHEFNFGRDVLNDAVSSSNFPWLGANIVKKSDGSPFFGKPYIVKTFPEGPRVAVLGLTTQYVPNWEKPENIKGMHFEDPVETAKRWVPFLKKEEKADLVVLSYHGGFGRDLDTGEPIEEMKGENQAYQMCQEVADVDVLLTGHQHRMIAGKAINGVTIIQPGSSGTHLGKVMLELEKGPAGWQVTTKQSELLSVRGEAADKDLLAHVDAYEKDAQTWLDQPLGKIDGDMLVHDPMKVRMQDHPLIEFINRLQMKASGADISATALFNNESPGMPPNVSMRDIVANYIYPNTLRVLRISGQDMRDALERSASYFALDSNGTVKVSQAFTDPKPQHYNYDMWEGINYILDLSKPVGSRVVELNYHGAAVNVDASYDVVMNNYRSIGGGEYFMFSGKPVVKDIPIDVTELIANEVLERKVIQATVDHNWKIIY
ncbi:bifunctional metallophosphatase/5'-nucleotidase [Sporolactobacillus terrae]|uniref:2',3'-cyclic-nucleotide 2'-phosphodiesterase n=1 Tax=Sporolactobacillus terrae TaxID=269673 RepID=A0A410DCH3_9BACL|nr:bifunctional UDP-sugar hydrolase/5'-nucleotidase [Sporolactobacillus terrae]QAA23732.1 bifunctional metallophosphatase/5'-nucleotidase [Sporolactobacillus terrae]QAA26704.1 bifunctional metallophosphatase/5'-nucleotidase [Sporolactobacillus terrae]UAK15770.1 bifunctional metallophosphatase/5'-nucleotidase [Sporolactobacillus terrae]BBO00265.1 2',3'-cyclic-nucleotide 2'-phosphodiesterase [Sporolactobacillus terrae]